MSEQRYDFTVHTYGCKVNTYDTGLLQKRLESKGHTAVGAGVRATAPGTEGAPPRRDAAEQASSADANKAASAAVFGATDAQAATLVGTTDLSGFGLGARRPRIHIMNTCAVTAEATREAARAVRRLKSKDPFSTVVVTGCGAQVDGETYDVLPGADLVVANSHKGFLEDLLDRHFSGQLETKVFRSNIFRKEDAEAGGGIEAGHTRAFLKIQDGCNSFCTYCVIPFARGKSRSISVKDLVKRINELHAQGSAEVVLTGVHIADYEDIAPDGRKLWLRELIEAVLEKTTIPRIRLSSLEPGELTPEILALYKNPRLCPHFHMSIQSANTRVLQAMRRRYDAQAVEGALSAIQEAVPGAFVGMDVIAGFPGETDEEFADTYARLEKLPWSRIHVFPYSERPGTKAAQFENSVPRGSRALRAQRLRDLSTQRFSSLAQGQIGLEKTALVLKMSGLSSETPAVDTLTRDYWPVKVSGKVPGTFPVGREIRVRITGFDDSQVSRMDGVLRGEWVTP
jgi:threonylcarbamoyladenosine tRNA methylthiotransferase MtaB